MTSAPIGDRSAPLDTSSCVTCMLPATSAQPASTPALHPSGRIQVSTCHGNHRRRPPENTVSLVHAHTRLATHAPTADEVHGSGSGIGVKSSSPQIALAPGSLSAVDRQPMQMDFPGGSGDSSSAEGRRAASGGGSRRRSTQKSTAQDWFNSLNREVGGNGTYDNDSPYYMPNHRHRKYPQASRGSRSLKSQRGATAEWGDQQSFGMPAAVGLRGDSTEGSNNSDSFRSVIDDLTIKNQKLKKRLRKLENLHGRNAPAERLFEVRVHDLPEGKKLELERLLQNFTASLCSEGALDPNSNSLTPGGLSSIVDSGYASVSRYGNDSTHESRNSGGRAWPLPQSNSEITKMTLVVGKLEQLFTGRERIAADRSMLLQQDISDVAAANDQVTIACAGEHSRAEGFRAASFEDLDSRSDVINSSDSTDTLAEQRPTRPMDLDPQREQVAEENIEYLTHMTESSTKGPEASDGWVYLNLIINLAQLHTVNVTPPFVRKAIAAASTKLELSPDGKMVRWRGGEQGAHFSNTDSSSGNGGDDSGEQSPPGGDGKKNESMSRSGYDSRSGADSSSGAVGLVLKTSDCTSLEHRFHYKPLFGRSQSSDDDSSSCVASSEGESPKRSDDSDSRGVEKDSGPIIFYKGGAFCTDLSSQELRDDDRDDRSPQTRYVRATARPLGSVQWDPEPWSCKANSPLCLAGTTGLITPEDSVMRVDDEDGDMLIQFSPQFTATSPVTTPPEPIEFEASGLGGVLPADNFAINCQTRHYILPDHGPLPMPRAKAFKDRLHKMVHHIPKTFIDTFYDQGNMTDSSAESTGTSASHKLSRERLLRHEILSAQTLKLAPSQLPPASYIFASPSEDSSSYDGTDSDNAPRSLGPIGDVGSQVPTPFDAYRIPSSDGSGCAFERSPSSAATAGDGSNPSSITGFGVEDSTFDESMSANQFSSVECAYVPPVDVSAVAGPPHQSPSGLDLERPQLKRSRGSAVSSASTDQIRKSVRLETSSD